ncbi:MAG: efflux RND transporter permease subunit [Deltaproteobacteria bacterium]|nr:efflux RND transporter permease subunit [Deltaproteobacteria bacterium]
MLDRLLDYALAQRLMVVLAGLILAAVGAWLYRDIPIDAFPDISSPQVQVIVKAPGMGPVEVEQRITHPIEVQVRGIPNQTILRSVTKYALSVITIDFEDNTDIYWARQQVDERIGRVLSELPDGIEGGLAPITMPLSDVYMFLVESEAHSTRELRSILDWMIRPRLLSVPGVADVNALGGEVRSFDVRPNPGLLSAYDLTIANLEQAIQQNNRNAGGDRFVRHGEVLLVRTTGQLQTLEDIRNVTVATRDGVPLHVHDVAEVVDGSLTRYGGVTRHGQGEGVQGIVLNRRGANSRRTVDGVKAALEEIATSLPKGVRIEPFYDRSKLIERAVSTVESALLQAIVLVLVVLLLFLGLGNLRSALTVGTVLPLTVLGVFIPMYVMGLTSNLMSLGGLAIAVGMLVDSAVVMVENVHSALARSDRTQTKLEVVRAAAKEVATPMFSAVLIVVVTLLPIATLTGLEGKLFAPLAITVALALVVSLALSLTFIPVVASLVMKENAEPSSQLLRFFLRPYRPTITWVLAHRFWALGGGLALLVVAAFAFPFVGREFLPMLDEGTTVVQTEKLPTISLARSLEIDVAVEKALMSLPEIEGAVTRTGSDELRLDPMGLNEADIFLTTKPRAQWSVDDPEELLAKMREKLDAFPGMTYGFTQPIDMRVSEMLTGVRAAVAVKLRGSDLDELESKAQAIEAVIRKTRGAVDVMRAALGGQSYLTISMDHAAMGRVGVSGEAINDLVTAAIGGRTVTEVIEGIRRIPVQIRYPEEARSSAAAIGNLLVRGASGSSHRLDGLTEITEEDGPVQIQREGGERQVVIQVNVVGRDVVSFVHEVREKLDATVALAPGYYVTFGGQFENQQRAADHLSVVIPAAIGLILLLLFLTFNSLRQALLILFNIPLALVGGVLILLASGYYLSVPASVGFIALLGIVIQNGVVLVTYFNQLRARGASVDEAIREGTERRLRPVLMTALLTILGLLPLLIATGPGSEIQKPLALVVVGGVFTSTALTLVLLPALYSWLERRAESNVTGGGSRHVS